MLVVSAQKRSALVDLDMLFADPSSYANYNPGEGLYRREGAMLPPPDFQKLHSLAETLKRLHGLDKFYQHQGRSRSVHAYQH
ncbi:hypothetical protein RvY_13934 [Ramazzottius varieornatus]|uniref:Uncharacterized protein n=1 Tax=Ramazzottius varieornatus TaxID=947166 RepID=A0A1D1VPM6_RAMVA|nr:hypothetical protein RvY_13934 [Ramazzottius varieornatus]